jgi:DNA topoisomerase VI subunit B
MQQKVYLPSSPSVVKPRGDSPAGPRLARVAFKTSRLAEFCSRRELVAQTGHDVSDWPLVILKELVDNGLDGCEEAETSPEIDIEVSTASGEIVVSDNGPGIPEQTVRDILDYSFRVSSREAYVSPTRGAQGNALKTLVAMPFALHGEIGKVVIESCGVGHAITFSVDQLRQLPAIEHGLMPLVPRKKGTRITVFWPDSASSILASAKDRFLQIAADFGWLNPHLLIRAKWNGGELAGGEPTDPAWEKWPPCDPTSAHWYDQARLERYIAAHVARDQENGRERTVREFISELRGFSGSAKQKRVLDETGLAREQLASLFDIGGVPRNDQIAALHAALRQHSKPVKPKNLGVIGRDHFRARFENVGVEPESFKYSRAFGETEGLPWVVETAFGWCPSFKRRRIIVGVNWSVGLVNPFRSFGRTGEGLESVLAAQRAGRDEPVVFILHFACPRAAYTDRGKSAVVLPEGSQ